MRWFWIALLWAGCHDLAPFPLPAGGDGLKDRGRLDRATRDGPSGNLDQPLADRSPDRLRPDQPNPCPSGCGAKSSCKAGACVCDPGFADCNLSSGDGCEVSLATDPENCNSCGKTCAKGTACVAGACVCDPKIKGSCGTDPAYVCATKTGDPYGKCAPCPLAKTNCDLLGEICECVGFCDIIKGCKTACDPTKTGQCGSIYHACVGGICEPCPPGTKNCSRQATCDTKIGDPKCPD